MIRSYRPADAAGLARIYSDLNPRTPLSAAGFHAYLAAALQDHGRVWTITDGEIAGYAAVFPLPGLPGIVELDFAIAPPKQGHDLVARLLARVKDELRGTDVRQITYQVQDGDERALRFLGRHGFRPEHDECFLELDDLARAPEPSPLPGLAVRSRPRVEAIPLFQNLYAESFTGLPWAQPYSAPEIAALLDQSADLLFLEAREGPLGFAWLQMETGARGVIEPLGIVPSAQGRGYGRFLLLCALRTLGERGAQRAQIGAWCNNPAALGLYTAVGFRHVRTLSYLACDL